jgi:hypothetical protein
MYHQNIEIINYKEREKSKWNISLCLTLDTDNYLIVRQNLIKSHAKHLKVKQVNLCIKLEVQPSDIKTK